MGLSAARTLKLLRAADADGSGEISLEEWRKAVRSGIRDASPSLCSHPTPQNSLYLIGSSKVSVEWESEWGGWVGGIPSVENPRVPFHVFGRYWSIFKISKI